MCLAGRGVETTSDKASAPIRRFIAGRGKEECFERCWMKFSIGTTLLLEGKTLVHGKPAVYVCQNCACKAPLTGSWSSKGPCGIRNWTSSATSRPARGILADATWVRRRANETAAALPRPDVAPADQYVLPLEIVHDFGSLPCSSQMSILPRKCSFTCGRTNS